MNKEKGFTLVELIAALVILSLVLVIAVPSVNRLLTKNKKKAYEGKIEVILKQAKLYARDEEDFIYNSGKTYDRYVCNVITVGQLKAAGYLEQLSDEDGSSSTITDPRDKSSMENKKIMVYIKSSSTSGNDVYSGTLVSTDINTDRCVDESRVFAYKGKEQVMTITKTGKYKLEVWGAQGGDAAENYIGGFGAYAVGEVNLSAGDKLYINVGGQGSTTTQEEQAIRGGYNGGGIAIFTEYTCDHLTAGSGGGATSIATTSGLLENLSTSQSNILIVAGGGGGSGFCHYRDNAPSGRGGSAGGIKGNDSYETEGYYSGQAGLGATQSSGGCRVDGTVCSSFGTANKMGATPTCTGGGGGYYGGGPGWDNGAGGGSSYIGNTLLSNKVMYCYNCEESSAEATKTISTTCNTKTPEANCAKRGAGYAKITFVE